VSANVHGLKACTTYHFRLVATNPDGRTKGADNTFRTRAERPGVLTRRRVRRHRRFTVRISLSAPGKVTIFIARHRHLVTSIRLGFHGVGTFSVRIRAPRRRGRYILTVVEKESCGTQFASTRFSVS